MWGHLIRPVEWKHLILAASAGEPGRPVALAVLEQAVGTNRKGQYETARLDVRHLQQVPAGASLHEVAKAIDDVFAAAAGEDESAAGARLLLDTSALGSVVYDLLGKLAPQPVVVVDGLDERATGAGLAVPRRELAGTLRLALETDRLRVLETPLADVFKAALLGFTMRPPSATGDDQLAALRREAEDDLVISVALTAWLAGREVPGPRGPAIDPRRSRLGDYDPYAEWRD